MYSTFSLGSEASASALNEPGCEQQRSAKSILTVGESLPGNGPMSPSTMTSSSSMALDTPEQLSLFAEETLAKPTATPEPTGGHRNHRLITSCGLLVSVALALFSGRI